MLPPLLLLLLLLLLQGQYVAHDTLADKLNGPAATKLRSEWAADHLLEAAYREDEQCPDRDPNKPFLRSTATSKEKLILVGELVFISLASP